MGINEFPIEKQISCVKRELSMRKRVYPRWIALGKMTEDESQRQIGAMAAVLATLERVQASETKQAPLI